MDDWGFAMTLENILTELQDWSGIAALPLAALALRLNFLRYRASVSEKLPDIRLHQLECLASDHGPYYAVRYEIKNRSDKNLHFLAIVVKNAGSVRHSDGRKRDGYGGRGALIGFSDSSNRIVRKHHIYPSGSHRGESGIGGDSTYGILEFQTDKKHGKLKICFEYAFSSEDEKRHRKTFTREISSFVPPKDKHESINLVS